MMAHNTQTRIDWDALRHSVPVESLARARYGEPRKEKTTKTTAEWATDHGRLIVGRSGGPRDNQWKFMDSGVKGHGAIDWLVKVEGMTPLEAAERLGSETFTSALSVVQSASPKPPKPYVPIPDNPALWPAVRDYLVTVRKLPADLVDQWHNQDRVRAIVPSAHTPVPYASFPIVSPEGKEVGAMLRCAGTPEQQRDQARFSVKRNQEGSLAACGYWSSHDAPQAQTLILVETSIDGMALYAALVMDHRDPADFVIRAGAGAALNPVHWSGDWAHIMTAFDRDAAGEEFHHKVEAAHPDGDVRRLTPPPGHKDWAEAWTQAVSRYAQQSPRQPNHDYEPGED